jgi:hypothetical protein
LPLPVLKNEVSAAEEFASTKDGTVEIIGTPCLIGLDIVKLLSSKVAIENSGT